MDYKTINELLDKYWEGETSIAEEKILQKYFNSDAVAEELKAFQPMFQYFKTTQEVRMDSSDFDERLLAQLTNEPAAIVRTLSPRRRLFSLTARAAAIILLVVSGYWAFQNINNNNHIASVETTLQLEDLTEEERIAFEETKAALAFVSTKLNKGAKIATDNIIKINQTRQKVSNGDF